MPNSDRPSRWRRVGARAVDHLVAFLPALVLAWMAVPVVEKLLVHQAGKVAGSAVAAADFAGLKDAADQVTTIAVNAVSLVLLVITAVTLVVLCLYDWLAHAFFRRTLGKALFGIAVVRGGDAPGFGRCFLRTGVLFGLPGIAVCWAWTASLLGSPTGIAVPVVFGGSVVGLLLALGPTRRALHDRLSGTEVARR